MINFIEAKKIRESSKRSGEGEGRQIVKLLLAAGDVNDFSKEELDLLCVGYNWAIEHRKAYETSLIAINKFPNDLNLMRRHRVWASNFLGHSMELVEDYKQQVKQGKGPRAFWYLAIADVHSDLAYFTRDDQDWEWFEDLEVISEFNLNEAAKFLELAVTDEPSLLMEPSYIEFDTDWNTRYQPILHHPKFSHLKRRDDQ